MKILDAHKIAKLPTIKPILVKWFGEDPGQYPSGTVPPELQKEKETYVDHLLAAYGERSLAKYTNCDTALADMTHGPHLRDQRTRYFEANWFMRYYRDNTPKGTVESFKEEIYHGVIDEHRRDYRDALARVDGVLSQAAKISVTGTLSRYAKNPVKQGTCHHLANEGDLSWKP
ncbi:MAG: ABC-three component system protein [Hyphomicrobiales bacterium]|nr:ABC-three component system protein [Hyphomicrobiales bacterium]